MRTPTIFTYQTHHPTTTMSNSTLNESKDQMRVFSTNRMKTSRNHSLNLLTTDVNRKYTYSTITKVFLISIVGGQKDRDKKLKLMTMQPRVPSSLKPAPDQKKSMHQRVNSMSNFSSLNCSDIPGAQPRQPVPKLSKTYSSLGNEDIYGSKPRQFYCNS